MTEQSIEPDTLAPVSYLPGADSPTADTDVVESARRILEGATLDKIDTTGDDEPLLPAWTKSAEGWAARSGVAYRASRRATRRWARRQRTSRGHAAQFRRGSRRVHDWAIGFEGVHVDALAHAAHIATKEARAAARAARFTPAVLPNKKKAALKAAEKTGEAARKAVDEHKKAREHRRRIRSMRLGAVYGPPLAAITGGYAWAGWFGLTSGALATFAAGAFAGRHPVNEETDWSIDWRSLGDGDAMTAPMLDEVFRAAKVMGGEENLRVIKMPMLDTNGAWTAVIDLPPGIPSKKAMAAHAALASGFGVEEAQLTMTKAGRSGRLELYVTRDLPFTQPAGTGPLLHLDKPANFWGRISIGPDVRGLSLSISVVERSGLVGGEPGAGKSASGNTILLAAALDPRVILWLADGKGGGDLEPFEPLCEHFEGDADPEAFYEMLKAALADMKDRYALLKKLGKRKVTEELADEHPLLRQKLLWVDELMFYTTDDDYGKKITKALRNLVSRGRAAGIVTFCATQKPGSDVVDTSLRDLLSIRWALRCTTPEASDTILGKGAAAAGYSAKTIEPEMRGAGLLWAEGSNPTLVRADYYTDDQVTLLLKRAWAWRDEAGTLPRTITDQLRETGEEDAVILAELLDAFREAGDDTDWLPGSALTARLAAAGIEVTAERLGALVTRTEADKRKREWEGSRVAGYPLAAVQRAVESRYNLAA
ncbi:FtsK/SpoIIIE domain-containing protein [Streptomyces sp. NPDC003720]|uniref:FtsK/SpoIIIE domain-containing protein n=1 Tax=Streptomyces sp. NPDC003720 TaxID=3364684 RepID=UPI0036B3CB6D